MKIAILTEILSTHSGSRAPVELAKHLSLSNEITLIVYALKTEKRVKRELEKKGVKVFLINSPKIPFGRWLVAFKVLPHLRGQDIISFHGTLPTFLVAKLSGLPLVKTYYGTQLNAYLERLLPYQKPTLKDKFLNWLGNKLILIVQRIYFRLSDQVVAISKYTSKEAKKLYGRKIPFIHLGAAPLSSNQQLTINNQQFPTILSISRFTPYKGFHLLIEAVKRMDRKVNLFIVGSASQPKYLDYLKEIKTPNTKILVDISDQELANLYRNCDLYATCDRYLFFGLPPLEAALFGKPTLALDFCAAHEIIIHGKTGLVAKNLEKFKKSLVRLIQNGDFREQLGRNAKKRVEEKFTWKKTAQKYEEIFRKHENRA